MERGQSSSTMSTLLAPRVPVLNAPNSHAGGSLPVKMSARSSNEVTDHRHREQPLASTSSNTFRNNRERRYTREEEALHNRLRLISTERSPEELQIRALENATALLSAHAIEAHQRSQQLREKLSQTDLDAANYQALKRQRWIEEHRASLADSEERVLKERLNRLAQKSSSSMTSMNTDTPIPRPPTVRKEANLTLFLQNSPTKKTLLPSHSAKKGQRKSAFSDIAASSPSSYAWLARSRVDAPTGSGHGRSRSLATIQLNDENEETDGSRGTRILKLRATQSFQRPNLRAIDERSNHVEHVLPPSTNSDGASQTSVKLKPPSITLLAAPPALSLRSTSIASSKSANGHAVILPPPAPRPANEILANLGEVPIPSYAVNLIDSFSQRATPVIPLTPQAPRTQTDNTSESSSAPLKVIKPPPVSFARVGKRRSIFSIDLPRKSMSSNSPSQGRLSPPAPSIVSTRISEERSVAESRGSNDRRRTKIFRSTRDWDLSQLQPAPDDVEVDWIHLPLSVELPSIGIPSGRDQIQLRPTGFRGSVYSSPLVNKIRQRFSMLRS